MANTNKIDGVTHYHGISAIYLISALRYLIYIGKLNTKGLRVLDYGCGHGLIKKICTKSSIINFDILPELSDVPDWRRVDFDVLVSNHVFLTHTAEQLEAFCIDLLKISKQKKKTLKIISGHSMNTIFNKIGKVLLNRTDAHNTTILNWKEIDAILGKHFKKTSHHNFFFLTIITTHET